MLVHVGDILLDRDNRRAGREVEVDAVHEDFVTIRTVKSIGGLPVENGTLSEVSMTRLPKAYKHKFNKGGFTKEPEQKPEQKISPETVDAGKLDQDNLKKEIVEDIMKLAEPGNKVILDRLSALESRVNSIEYGGQGYWKPTVYSENTPNTTTTGGFEVDGSVTNVTNVYPNAMTGSVVSNYPSVDEVLEKVLAETDSEEFEYLWNRLASEGKNPHEAVVRLVYNLLTK